MTIAFVLKHPGQAPYVRQVLAKQRWEVWQYLDNSGKSSTSVSAVENTTGKENYK
jgi:hypothetical protein